MLKGAGHGQSCPSAFDLAFLVPLLLCLLQRGGGRALMTPCVYFIPLQLNVGFLPLLFFLGFTGSTVTLQLCNDAS